MSEWLAQVTAAAAEVLPRGVFDWLDGGSGTEWTLRENVRAWGDVVLRPDHLVDVTTVSTSTTLLGTRVATPVGVAPTGFHGVAHPDGEVATAQAAATAGDLLVLSARTSLRLEDIAEHCGPWWYQSYIFQDRTVTDAMVRRAADCGARAVVLTVDAPVLGRRRRNRDQGLVDRSVMEINSGPVSDPKALEQTADLTLADIGWMHELTGLPVVVKGVLRGDTAQRCVEAGASAIWVSNHGGRQLDGAVPAAAVLPEVVASLDGSAEVYADGGVSNGTDVLRALALGADGVFLGRPPLWGLATGGREGVEEVLDSFRVELETAMRLCGRTTIESLGRDLVWGGPGGV
nr:L-lactate dehydrogenase [Aeromicrobium sp.]